MTKWNNTFQHFSILRKSLELGAEYISYINLQCHDCDIYCDPDSLCFLADSRRLWLCLFRLGLRTGTSRANNAYIASKNQSYFCSLHVQICARFTYFLQDILQGQCSTIYLKHSKTNMTLACKSSVAMSVRVFV